MTDCECSDGLPMHSVASKNSRAKNLEFFIQYVFGVIGYLLTNVGKKQRGYYLSARIS